MFTFIQTSNGATTTGTLSSGAEGTAVLCLARGDDGGCHTFKVSAGDYPTEITWLIVSETGETVGSGGAPTTASVCFRPPPTPLPSASPRPSAACAVGTFRATCGCGGRMWGELRSEYAFVDHDERRLLPERGGGLPVLGHILARRPCHGRNRSSDVGQRSAVTSTSPRRDDVGSLQ